MSHNRRPAIDISMDEGIYWRIFFNTERPENEEEESTTQSIDTEAQDEENSTTSTDQDEEEVPMEEKEIGESIPCGCPSCNPFEEWYPD